MSQTPVQPHPEVARATGVVLFGGVLMTQFLGLPLGFRLESYLGVIMILSGLLAWAGAVGLLADGGRPVWWYALANGASTIFAWFFTYLFGLPVTETSYKGQWSDRNGLLLLFFSGNLVMLSAWVLRTRQRNTGLPVVSARDRVNKQA
jgi:hypothetical protein